MDLQAVIFDFDGVIADTEPLHFEAFRRLAAMHHVHFNWQEYLDELVGFDDRDLFSHAFQRRGVACTDNMLQSLVDEKAQSFLQLVDEMDVQPYPGVISLIRSIHGHVPLGLCSGALASDVAAVFHKFELDGYFEIQSTADHVHVSKPDPAPYLDALSKLSDMHPERHLNASQCVAFEDTNSGITSAKRAGLHVIGIANTLPPETLWTAGADAVIESCTTLSYTKLEELIRPW
ncbi:MAG: HAD family phosphatase [Spartobacteria bacterium]|nr:HAD family phosphatase [Spartobacteria bacterium]